MTKPLLTFQQWKRLLDEKPDPERSDPEDDRAIEEARRSIGDYKVNEFV